MIGRLGAIAAPFIILLPHLTPYIIFGVTGIISGISILFLPETKDQNLFQTINEAKPFYDRTVQRICQSSRSTTVHNFQEL